MECKEEENTRDAQNGTQAFQPYFIIWAASSESLSLEMLKAIAFVLFIPPQRLGDESTAKSFRRRKWKVEPGDTLGQSVPQSNSVLLPCCSQSLI